MVVALHSQSRIASDSSAYARAILVLAFAWFVLPAVFFGLNRGYFDWFSKKFTNVLYGFRRNCYGGAFEASVRKKNSGSFFHLLIAFPSSRR